MRRTPLVLLFLLALPAGSPAQTFTYWGCSTYLLSCHRVDLWLEGTDETLGIRTWQWRAWNNYYTPGLVYESFFLPGVNEAWTSSMNYMAGSTWFTYSYADSFSDGFYSQGEWLPDSRSSFLFSVWYGPEGAGGDPSGESEGVGLYLVPEPASMALLATGLAGVGMVAGRRRRRGHEPLP